MNNEDPIPQPATKSPENTPNRPFLTQFVLTSVAGLTGLGQIYANRKAPGIVRLCLFGLATLLFIIATINGIQTSGLLVAFVMLIVIILTVWAVVDMLIVFSNKHRNPIEYAGDKVVAQLFMFGTLAMICATTILIISPVLMSSTGSPSSKSQQSFELSITEYQAREIYQKIDSSTTPLQLQAYFGGDSVCEDNTSCTYRIPDISDPDRRSTFEIWVSVYSGTVSRKSLRANSPLTGSISIDDLNTLLGKGTAIYE